jgi:hypothetical protein
MSARFHLNVIPLNILVSTKHFQSDLVVYLIHYHYSESEILKQANSHFLSVKLYVHAIFPSSHSLPVNSNY